MSETGEWVDRPKLLAALKSIPGWGFPMLARKAHWFDEGEATSVCGKWMYTGVRSGRADEPGPDDCATCRKILRKRQGYSS